MASTINPGEIGLIVTQKEIAQPLLIRSGAEAISFLVSDFVNVTYCSKLLR
jgi:hypothetical protein